MGLFERQSLKVLDLPPSLSPRCGHCKVNKMGCKSQKMTYGGKGRRKILVVTDVPTEDEDRRGRRIGNAVASAFRKVGISVEEDCWLDSALACRPPGGRMRESYWTDDCRPHLIKTVTELKPEVIILMGGDACQSLFGWLWDNDDVGSVFRWAGYVIPHRRLNCWIVPTYHPAYLSEKERVLQKHFAEHMRAATRLKDRPYPKGVPKDNIVVEMDVNRAAKQIRFVGRHGAGFDVAFDYETTCLKPHGPFAEIYTCSIAFPDPKGGEWAIAYPWQGAAIEATKELLLNKNVRKVASNVKFEESWTRKHLGVRVRGWHRDTMLAAHGLENGSKVRRITGLKFQAFAHLGVDPWDKEVKEYLGEKDKTGNNPNRIKQCDLRTVLEYNAKDSLYELQLSKVQNQILGDR